VPDTDVKGIRLSKYLADAGVASRRAAESLILAGRVTVDGVVVAALGTRVVPGAMVAVDGVAARLADRRSYVLVHKPIGYVSTARDPQGRPTVLDLAPRDRRLYPVGRLDYDSEGLVLLTDDGEVTLRLTHPRYGVVKEYHALVQGHVDEARLKLLRAGVQLDDGVSAPAEAVITGREGSATWLRLRIAEGRNRQVRRMCYAVGLAVARLIRTRLGPLSLGDLPPGGHRSLSRAEVASLRASLGLPAG
jgi:pseudouridine synthase